MSANSHEIGRMYDDLHRRTIRYFAAHDYNMHLGYWDDETRSAREASINLNREGAKVLSLRRGMKVLDAGCGYGGGALWLARNYGVQVIGISVSERQVRVARALALKQDMQHLVQFSRTDYAHTNFADGSFDAIVAIESLCHAEDRFAAIRELTRVLRPCGMMAIAEGVRAIHVSSGDRTAIGEMETQYQLQAALTSEEYRALLASAGLSEAKCQDITQHVLPSGPSLRRVALACALARKIPKVGRSPLLIKGIAGGTLARLLASGSWRHVLLSARKAPG